METITISLQELAEHMAVSYEFNDRETHLERCAAYKVLVGDDAFHKAGAIAQQIVDKKGIRRHKD